MKKRTVNILLVGTVLLVIIVLTVLANKKTSDVEPDSAEKEGTETETAEYVKGEKEDNSMHFELSKEEDVKTEGEQEACDSADTGEENAPIEGEQEAGDSTDTGEENAPIEESPEAEEVKDKEAVFVKEISAERAGREQILISFEPVQDVEIASYYLMRKENNDDASWIVTQEIEGDIGKDIYSITDVLENSEIKQYVYRVDVKPADEDTYEGKEGTTILASNALVCIDPGHFAGRNQVTGEKAYDYTEGDFTIKIGLALRDVLKEKYGIDSYMTRETGTITLGGYTNASLDRGHISLRGQYAGERDSDLFISLHTNANNDNANGYPTCLQPIDINKTIVLANMIACESETAVRIGNSIGINLSQINYDKGLSSTKDFDIGTAGAIEEWTVAYNDSLNNPGSIRCRLSESGDYYGVLKGANMVGVPGIIVEHGLHTVAEMREQAAESDLYKLWAEADAYGIAYGFGFETNIQMTEEN